jgi:hypothetical protein
MNRPKDLSYAQRGLGLVINTDSRTTGDGTVHGCSRSISASGPANGVCAPRSAMFGDHGTEESIPFREMAHSN